MSQAIKEGAFTLHMTPDEVAKVNGSLISFLRKQPLPYPTPNSNWNLITFIRILFSLFFHFLEGSLRVSLGKNKAVTGRHFSLIIYTQRKGVRFCRTLYISSHILRGMHSRGSKRLSLLNFNSRSLPWAVVSRNALPGLVASNSHIVHSQSARWRDCW